jgi:hypothetical protein
MGFQKELVIAFLFVFAIAAITAIRMAGLAERPEVQPCVCKCEGER